MAENQDDDVIGSDDTENADDSAPIANSTSALHPTVQARMDALTQQMAAAQNQASQNTMGVNLARAGATMANALSGSQRQADQTPFNQLESDAQSPVTNVLNQQKAASNDLTIQKNLSDAQTAQNDNDPDSPASQRFRATLKASFPKIAAAYGDDFDDLSAADQKDVFKVLETKAKLDQSKDIADLRNDTARSKISEKTENDQASNYTKMRKDLESFRGNQAVQQAAVKVQNADTALAIVKGKDPNTLTSQDLRLLAEEMGKIATGGVPGEHGTEALMPNNLRQKLAEMQAFLTNKPTDAQAGEYIKHNMEYLEQMKEVAKGTLTRYRQNIAKGYKNRVKQDDYSEAMSDYGIGGNTAAGVPTQSPDLHASVAAEIQRRQAAKASGAVASMVPQMSAQPNAQGVPSSLQPNPPGFAYGGSVGGLLSSNYSASQMNHSQRAPALHIHSPRGYADGGQIPGQPAVPQDNPVNDKVQIMATPKEVVLPLHVTQAKDPALAAYLFMKQLHGKVH